MIIEEFKEHMVTYWQYGKIEELIWRKPGSSVYAIFYLYKAGTLYVSGDVGSAVYRWHSSIGTLRNIAGCQVDYFASKCEASEYGRDFREWNSHRALEEIETLIKSGNCPDLSENWAFNGEYSLDTRQSFLDWASARCKEPEEWANDIGMEIAGSCKLHLAGLKAAFAQLKDI